MAKINTMTFEQQKESCDMAFLKMKKRNFSDTKINKLFCNWDFFKEKISYYITTFESEQKRALFCDEYGFYFNMNKEKERITEAAEIERITNFLNIK